MIKMIKYLVIIQARFPGASNSRFPGKVMEMVKGRTILKRVWDAAKDSIADKVIVAWPERFPDLDENNVLGRFQRLVEEFPCYRVIRLTADCPLITYMDINQAIVKANGKPYYSNHFDGKDVQVFAPWVLFSNIAHKEHVIADFSTQRSEYGPCSVDTPEDLKRVRLLAK